MDENGSCAREIIAVVISTPTHRERNGNRSKVRIDCSEDFDSVDRAISVDFEIENEHSNSCLVRNHHETDNDSILDEKDPLARLSILVSIT